MVIKSLARKFKIPWNRLQRPWSPNTLLGLGHHRGDLGEAFGGFEGVKKPLSDFKEG